MGRIKLGSGLLNAIYPVGSIYKSANNINPSTLFGGTWELIRSFGGGELIAYGHAYNSISNNEVMNKSEELPFSDSKIPSKKYSITSFDPNVLKFDSGTFHVYTKNVVGMVEAIYVVSGLFGGNGGLWFKDNFNELPSGITIHNNEFGPILGNSNSTYGGASRNYFYYVDEDVTNNLNFYVNPTVQAYNTTFRPATGGVKCELLVKVYAKKQSTYIWKRTA